MLNFMKNLSSGSQIVTWQTDKNMVNLTGAYL